MEKQTRTSKPRVDLTGKKFGNLTPVYYIKGGKWHCRCECGNELNVDTRNLNSGHTTSCGCLQKIKAGQANIKDMTNYENDGIIVLERDGSDDKGVAQWKCLCKYCGNIFITRGKSIREGRVNSCGCVHSQNEQVITQMLLDNHIEFATQYTFPDLKGDARVLRFDFAIFQNGQLHHLIEFNGLQHYEKVQGIFGENFKKLQEYDKKKIRYCKDHNIELRVIRYNETYSLEDLI